MKLGINESQDLAQQLVRLKPNNVEVVICPSFVSLSGVARVLKNSNLSLGAQNVFWEAEGAYTGEVCANDLREVGCQFVIVGHSERRQHLGETDDVVHQKVKAALAVKLVPIVCVGETFEQRHDGATDYVLIKQVNAALDGINFGVDQQLIIAYEPVWVIGTGQAINPHDAGAAHQVIRQTLIDLFPLELIKNNCRIIYGGSVDSSNVSSFSRLNDTSGVLVGGASLKVDEFIEIVNNV